MQDKLEHYRPNFGQLMFVPCWLETHSSSVVNTGYGKGESQTDV
jgi:hypothetical protein